MQLDGDFTFFRGDRKSQNDLCLSNLTGLRKISDFCIHKIGWNFSDHYPISVTVNLDLYDSSVSTAASSDILSDPSVKSMERPRKVVSANVDWQGYRVIASQEIHLLHRKIDYLVARPNEDTLNDVVDTLSKGLYKAAKTCESKPERIYTPVQDITQGMRSADEMLVKYSAGLCSWNEFQDVNKSSVKEINKKHYSTMINSWSETLRSDDPKDVWNKIDWKGNCKNDDIFDHSPDIQDLAAQFKSKDAEVEEDLLDLDFGDHRVPTLDDEISRDELDTASKKVKEGKSTADGWVPKMLTEVSDVLFPILLMLFNVILQRCFFPFKWWFSVVIALFKNKGSRLVSKNFRPVSLVVMFSKLFDFVLLSRFKKWFKPHDMQTAYQEGKSCCDHIFLMRCLIQQFNLDKRKLFITAIDFDGAFDRVKRSTLLKKLVLVGASSLFVNCLANLYAVSGNTMYSNGESIMYMLYSGIKQGLPLSPYLFLFYINDVFEYLEKIFGTDSEDVLNNLHILIHADDANLIAISKQMMITKLKSMLSYCQLNSIVLQPSKCFFTVVNASPLDKTLLQLTNTDVVEYRDHLEILGSHISGSIKNDLLLHFKKRFINVIKFFNYVRANQLAPVSVKLKVLKSCVMSTLLYNCEAFGPKVPEGLEQIYYKMLRAALGVRTNCSNLTILIESGCLPIQCLIRSRQLKYFRRFTKSLPVNSIREAIFNKLLIHNTEFLDHYIALDATYTNVKDLKDQYKSELQQKVRDFARDKDKHFKYWTYLQLNPELTPSPFLSRIDYVGKCITKFRLGSHKLKIEIGRWYRTPREERLCSTCNVLGDEKHIIYSCTEVFRGDLIDLPTTISAIWSYAKVNTLFQRIYDADYID